MLDCLVIGAGPAGLTAAIYLQRLQRRIAVLDAGDSRAERIERTHNYPGFPQGVSGPQLLQRMREQLTEAGGSIIADEATLLARTDDGSFVAQSRHGQLRARTVLLATGVCDAEPAIEGIAELRDRGLLRQCPICDAHEFRGRRILVIGRGDHGAREALFLHPFSAELTLVVDPAQAPVNDRLRASLQQAGIVCVEAVPQAVEVNAQALVRLHCEGTAPPLEADVIYAALGAQPRARLGGQVGATLDALGTVIVDAHGRSSVPGLHAAGDVVSALDQIAVAVGHGAIVATAIHNALAA
ncbi:NAD(P)/FAD-dependent oxidoreductase [Aquincola sp. S2]|uniref:NAD(P)/FAD-dependent oxidoreductase n=1 Tax=Pseudaquabacterium terrae TaxID=2732868 RepID=A0ABX2EML6_9BURK|nr:NAD(P)/FAD-dependent oxidoreductase [Aquabacterium terrae]NRF69873.1 NAD(P)/FAD-dependent oxidoreductase [Aquabacterium terrae]